METDPRWMWAHAMDLMGRAERLHQQFFRLAASPSVPTWEPPADVFEDGRDMLVVVALPGVAEGDVQVLRDAQGLVIRAERSLPFADSRLAVRRLEIPYGGFERRIALPAGRFDLVAHELELGCLTLRLRKAD